MVKIAAIRSAFRRPSQSAVSVHESAPKRPPVWKRPLIAPSRFAAFGLVSSAKYVMKEGWPRVVAIMLAQYPYVRLPSATKSTICKDVTCEAENSLVV